MLISVDSVSIISSAKPKSIACLPVIQVSCFIIERNSSISFPVFSAYIDAIAFSAASNARICLSKSSSIKKSQKNAPTPCIIIKEPTCTLTLSPAHIMILAALAAIPSTTTLMFAFNVFNAL